MWDWWRRRQFGKTQPSLLADRIFAAAYFLRERCIVAFASALWMRFSICARVVSFMASTPSSRSASAGRRWRIVENQPVVLGRT